MLERRTDIQSRQPRGNPMCMRISGRNGHAIESKALAMSILSNKQGSFLAWSRHAEHWTN
jgi:hypothetical protein